MINPAAISPLLGLAMNLRAFALTLILVFAVLLLLVMLNWTAFAAPTSLSLGLVEFNAPIGMVMLVFTVAISALFVVYILFQQAGVILEARRHAKEGKVQRELADKAEASRFTELRALIVGELSRIEAQSMAASRELSTRLDQSDSGLQEKLAEATRTISAYLGEIEDKLDRALVPTRP
jgi:predicted membrane protein